MKNLKLILPLFLLFFIGSSFTIKQQKQLTHSAEAISSYYLGTFDFITEDELVLSVHIYGHDDGLGNLIVDYGENAGNHQIYTISGSVYWIGSVKWADLVMTWPSSLSQAGPLYW